MAIERLSPEPFPQVINVSGYKDTAQLYTSASGSLRTGGGGSFRQRNGIAITVTIPPLLNAFRYPNLVNSAQGTPYISNTDRAKLQDRENWFAATRKGKTETQRSANRKKVSTEFEISDFVTSLTWSASGGGNIAMGVDTGGVTFTDVSIGLDNTQGMFNYLPEGAKVTIWRRKSLSNSNHKNPYGGKWYRYITCYLAIKDRTASGRDQTMTITCRDRLAFAGASNLPTNKKWTTGKKNHTKGWSPKEVTIDICKLAEIPYDASKIPTHVTVKKTVTTEATGKKTTTFQRVLLPLITNYEPGSNDVYSCLVGAWNRSVQKMAKKNQLPFTIHMRQGILVVEFTSPPGEPLTQVTDPNTATKKQKSDLARLVPMFNDIDNIETGTLNESIDPEKVYTVLHSRGRWESSKKGKNNKGRVVKKVHKIKDVFFPFADNKAKQDLIIQAYGKRLKGNNFKKHKFNSAEEFRVASQALIDNLAVPVRTLDITGRGPLGLWPNYYININSRYFGVKGLLLITSINYSITDGIINISMTLNVNNRHFSSLDNNSKFLPLEKNIWY